VTLEWSFVAFKIRQERREYGKGNNNAPHSGVEGFEQEMT
jgi:hypothetical protein